MTSKTNQTFRIRDRRGNNRYFIDNQFLRGGWGKKVGAYGIAVYNALALHVNADSQDGYPSYATIAELTGMSERQAMRKVAELESYNIICKESRFTDITGEQTSNDYVLLHSDEWLETPYDSQSRPPMTHSHPPYDSQSPKQNPINKTPSNNSLPKGKGAKRQPPTKSPIKTKTQNRPAAVDTYRSIACRFPDKATWPLLEPINDLEFWEQVIINYIACGWNKLNVAGMKEFYDRREIPKVKSNGNGANGKTNGRPHTKISTLDEQPSFDPYTCEYVYPDGRRERASMS